MSEKLTQAQIKSAYTCGVKQIHALQKAASEHSQTYSNVIKKT